MFSVEKILWSKVFFRKFLNYFLEEFISHKRIDEKQTDDVAYPTTEWYCHEFMSIEQSSQK